MKSMTKWSDPFDDMSDEEFDEHVDRLFAQRAHTVGISLRVQADLLDRVKRQAKRAVCLTKLYLVSAGSRGGSARAARVNA